MTPVWMRRKPISPRNAPDPPEGGVAASAKPSPGKPLPRKHWRSTSGRGAGPGLNAYATPSTYKVPAPPPSVTTMWYHCSVERVAPLSLALLSTSWLGRTFVWNIPDVSVVSTNSFLRWPSPQVKIGDVTSKSLTLISISMETPPASPGLLMSMPLPGAGP